MRSAAVTQAFVPVGSCRILDPPTKDICLHIDIGRLHQMTQSRVELSSVPFTVAAGLYKCL